MSDDQNKNRNLHPLQGVIDDDDNSDATVELSLKDVFNIKKQDMPKTQKPVSSSATMKLHSLQQDTDAEAERTINNSVNTMEILEEVELIPLDDDDDDYEYAEGSAATSVLSDYQKISMLDDMADWSVPTQSEAPAAKTQPVKSAIYSDNVDESTMSFSVPDTLLDELHDEDATLNGAIPEEWLKAAGRAQTSNTYDDEPDATIALSAADIQEAKRLAQREVHETDRSTSEMNAFDRAQITDMEDTLELEFVAAVDHNNRLFVPLRLFEEGKLKPGMRLLIRATVLK